MEASQNSISKREANKALIREKLVEVSFNFFCHKGLNETTVADIVEAAGIGRGTFYNYFGDVRAIFKHIVELENQHLFEAIREATKQANGFYDLLYQSFKAYVDRVSRPELEPFILKNHTHIREASYGTESLKKEVKNLREELRSQKSRGQFQDEREIKLLSQILVGAPIEMYLNLKRSGLNYTSEEIADFLAKLFTKGMRG